MRVARRRSIRAVAGRVTVRNTKRSYRTKVFANKKHVGRTFATQGVRTFKSMPKNKSTWATNATIAGALFGSTLMVTYHLDGNKVDWDSIRKEISGILEKEDYDDGSYGPVLIRLAWHASGTYDKESNTGGSCGGTMRFKPEAGHGANAGLSVARDLLEPIKKNHPEISYGDLWTLAGCVAIEEMGGPKIDWRPGRVDAKSEESCPPEGRLPDGEHKKGSNHVRDIFYRMGFDDKEIVCLMGAHALGRCHTDRSGYDGPWTTAPIAFTNEYYVQLQEATWTKRKWDGPDQFEDSTKTLMMLPVEIDILKDENFKKYIDLYAEDEDLFFADFAKAWKKLIELGVNFDAEKNEKEEKKSLWKRIFG